MEEQATDTTRFRRVVYERPPEADKVDPELSLEQLGERRAKISRLISEIAESFDSIRGQLESDRASEDPEWARRATGAQRFFSRQHQDHQRALGNLNRRIAQLGGGGGKQADRKAFIRHAREILPVETYDAIWDAAKRELRGDGFVGVSGEGAQAQCTSGSNRIVAH
jgi:hypothetical protein